MGNLLFLSPGLLALLPLALIPVALHFWQRRFAQPVPFSAIELLDASQQEVRRRITLKYLLLLLLKVLMLLALVFSAAKPVYSRKLQMANGNAPRDYVFLVDRSPSMQYVTGGSTLLDQAKERLRTTIHGALGNDRYALLSFAHGIEQSELTFFDNRQEALASVDALQGQSRSSNLGQALRDLVRMARGASFLHRPKFLVLSDFTTGIASETSLVAIEDLRRRGDVVFVDLAAGMRLENVVVDRVERQRTSDGFTLRFALRNSLSTATTAKLILAGAEVASAVIEPGQQSLVYSLGSVPARKNDRPDMLSVPAGELRFNDQGMRLDNAFYFNTDAERRFRVLIVNDDPSGKETYYLRQALTPTVVEAKTSIVADLVGSEGLEARDLSPYVGVFLVNLASLRLDRAKALEQAVRAGKLLFVILGDNEALDFYNRWEAMFPWQVLGTMDSASPLSLGRLASEGEWGRHRFSTLPFEKLQFRRYFSVTPLPQKDSRVLLSLDNGAPLLLSCSVDRGKVYLFASSLDEHWNNFPLKTAFLPFWHELITRSLPETEQRESAALTFDDAIRIHRSDTRAYALERLEDKLRVELTRRGADLVPVRPIALPGNYALVAREASRETVEGMLTVRYHPDEMSLVRLPALNAQSRAEGILLTGLAGEEEEEIKLWPYLHFLTVLLFALDGLALWLL